MTAEPTDTRLAARIARQAGDLVLGLRDGGAPERSSATRKPRNAWSDSATSGARALTTAAVIGIAIIVLLIVVA